MDTAFNPDAGIGVWRQAAPPPAATATSSGFVFISGRPYRWQRGALHDNTDFILGTFFGERAPTAVLDRAAPAATTLILVRAVPNPMNPRTSVPFVLPEAARVRAGVYDVNGRLVRVLLTGGTDAGAHRLTWNGLDAAGRQVASGVYFLEFEANGAQASTRIVITR